MTPNIPVSQLISSAAHHCLYAYNPKNSPCSYEIKKFSSKNVEGYTRLLRTPDGLRLMVVFAGSNDLKDWVINFNFSKSKQGIHKGWWNSYRSIKKEVDATIASYRISKLPLIVTGHSAGGALAGICALFYGHKQPVTLITFGQPKFCCQKVGDRLTETVEDYIRVINPFDPIIYLPLGDFVHAAVETRHALSLMLFPTPHSMSAYAAACNVSVSLIAAKT